MESREENLKGKSARMTHVLLVEDEDASAELVEAYLETQGRFSYRLTRAVSLAGALEAAEAGEPDAVLLDLGLSDSGGLATFRTFHGRFPEAPVIVLSGTDDEDLARTAVSEGAQEYLVKGKVTKDLLVRCLLHAMERQHLLNRLDEVRTEEARQRELLRMERMARQGTGRITERSFGSRPLQEAAPEVFGQLVDRYCETMGLALEERIHKVNHGASDRFRAIADDLGFYGCGPRDVVAVHTVALRRQFAGQQRSRQVVDEVRMMVLEVMGYLVSFYRRGGGGKRGRGNGVAARPPGPNPTGGR